MHKANNQQQKFCHYKGKKCAHYKSSLFATLAMLRIQRISKEKVVPCRVYKCKCGSYHLTHLAKYAA